ncbi:STAS domain-containing protein [Streptomyces sp. NPDC054838]
MRREKAGRREPGVIPPHRRATRTVLVADRYGLIHLTGELEVATPPTVHDAVRESLTGRPALLRIDTSGVSFCDCSGLGALLWAKAEAAEREPASTSAARSGPPSPASWTPPAPLPISACYPSRPSGAAGRGKSAGVRSLRKYLSVPWCGNRPGGCALNGIWPRGRGRPRHRRTAGTRRKGSPPRPAADLPRFRPGVAGRRSAPPGPE